MKYLSLVLAAAMACYAAAAETTTIGMFIDNMDPNAQWAGSVVDACSSTTTYAVACTAAPLGNGGCSAGASAVTITEGPFFYAATTPAIFSETSATITESCSLDTAASSAACVQTVSAGGYGQDIATTTSFGLSDQYYHQYQVAITAGVHKLANGGTCKSSKKSAAPAGPGNSLLIMSAVVLCCIGALLAL